MAATCTGKDPSVPSTNLSTQLEPATRSSESVPPAQTTPAQLPFFTETASAHPSPATSTA